MRVQAGGMFLEVVGSCDAGQVFAALRPHLESARRTA